MSVPSLYVATSGTGAPAVTADNLNSYVGGGALLATLRGFTGVSSMTVYMLGYTSPNDGGQGMFYWNTTMGTDDGGVTTIVPNGATSGCWSRSTVAGVFSSLSVTGSITPSQTAGIIGTTTNNNANAGSVGEYLTNTTTGVNLTNGNFVNLTSVNLTAGDWDVWGVGVYFAANSTVIDNQVVGISTTSATLGGIGTYVSGPAVINIAGGSSSYASPIVRVSIASTTTVFTIGLLDFSTSTATGSGFIAARRVR